MPLDTTYGVWIRKMTVPQPEIDTFHLGNCFRRILPLGHRDTYNIQCVNGENDGPEGLQTTRFFAALDLSVYL